MSSIIEGYNYDIFISYRQKDNKHDGWVTEFVDNLKGELESTFKEEVSVYFDINPHDGLLETHDVDESLKEKLKCLVFVPIISRTYCDPKSFAWEHEFKAFVEQAKLDQFGLKVKLPNGNVASRVLPVRIHDLEVADIKECESIMGGVLRGIEFIYKERGVNKPLTADDDEKKNLNKTKYRIQINKVANAIEEIVSGLKGKSTIPVKEMTLQPEASKQVSRDANRELRKKLARTSKWKLLTGIIVAGILLIVAVFLAYPKLFGKPDKTDLDKSVALMPFRNLTGDAANDFHPDMHREALFHELGKICMVESSLIVVGPKTTSMVEKNRMSASKNTGEKLVDYLVEGSILSTGDSLEILIRLIQQDKEEKFVWTNNYPSDPINILKLHHNVAIQIARGIGLELLSEDIKKLPQPHIVDPQSYEAYSRGMHELETATDEGSIKGLEYLLEAVSIAPEDPFANAGLAIGYLTIAHNNLDPGDALAKGEEYALKAMKLDSTIAEVHAALAIAYLYNAWKFKEAEIHFKRALQLNPNLDMAHYHYAWGLYLWGRMEEAIAEHKLAQKCDPYNPLHTAWLGGLYDFAGRYEEAVNEALKSFKIQKDFLIGYLVLGRAYVNMNRYEEAIKIHKKLMELYPNQKAPLCLTYIATGHLEKAEEILTEIEKKEILPIDAYNLAKIYARMGRKDEAFKWINYEPHYGKLAWAAVGPDFKSLHGDPRWDEFLKRLNLPKK